MKPNDPAFPVEYENGMAEIKTLGLTKREYFAALAMQGLLAGTMASPYIQLSDGWEKEAVKRADALIAELNKGGEK